jgi:hypothetical protein
MSLVALIIAQWSCEVPEEVFDDFLRWAEETLKPYYESSGCEEYSLFLPVERTYFSYQEAQAGTRYTEQFKFSDLGEYERFLAEHETDPEAKKITSAYRGRFKARSCVIRVYQQML